MPVGCVERPKPMIEPQGDSGKKHNAAADAALGDKESWRIIIVKIQKSNICLHTGIVE